MATIVAPALPNQTLTITYVAPTLTISLATDGFSSTNVAANDTTNILAALDAAGWFAVPTGTGAGRIQTAQGATPFGFGIDDGQTIELTGIPGGRECFIVEDWGGVAAAPHPQPPDP